MKSFTLRVDLPPSVSYRWRPMIRPGILTGALGAVWLTAGGLSAQVVVDMRLDRMQYVAGEAVPAAVSITNNTGRDVVFQGESRLGWLDFMLRDERGNPVTPIAQPNFGAVKIPTGQTMRRQIDLAKLFRLSEVGTYAVNAVVRLPGSTQSEGYLSNRLVFTVTTAQPFWSQKVGVAGRANQTREYRVLTYSGDQKTALYVQILDGRTGTPYTTYSLGEALMFRRPMTTLDGQQRLHVLYLGSPSLWIHACVDNNGRLVSRDMHKRGPTSDPSLTTTADGKVQVAGSIPYDPVAEQKALNATHKLSERPPFVYQ